MSSISIHGDESSIQRLKWPQHPPSIEPESQQQPSSRLPNLVASPDCTTERSAVAIKPLRPSEPGIGNAVIEAQTQCPASRPSRLLALPAELRQRILISVLPYTSPNDNYSPIWQPGDTSVLRTCHRLHEEGTFILYSSNTFQVRGHDILLVPQTSDPTPIADFSLWFYHGFRNGSVHTLRKFYKPLPMRPEDVWLVRRWEINILGIDYYKSINDGCDPFKLGLVIQNRVQNLLNGLLQGQQHLKTLRIRWEGGECEARSAQHRDTILKPLRDTGMAIEEVFGL